MWQALIAGAARWRYSDGRSFGYFLIAEARRLAQKRLPRMIFNYVDGAASDEKAAQLNMDGLSDLRLMPRVLRNVSSVPCGPLSHALKTQNIVGYLSIFPQC